jgi:hypothetical protein
MKIKILVLKLIPLFGFFIYAFIWFISHLFRGKLFKEINTWNKIGFSWFVLIISFIILYMGPLIYVDRVGNGDNLKIILYIWFVISGIISNLLAFKLLDRLTGEKTTL